MNQDSSEELQECLDRLEAGDVEARNAPVTSACKRLRRLTKKMFPKSNRLRRWMDTDDVFNNSILRLIKALEKLTPETKRDFFQLAAIQIRRELVDLARFYYRPNGLGARHDSHFRRNDDTDVPGFDPPAPDDDNRELEKWIQFHEEVEKLPPSEREVVSLVFYHGKKQPEVARILRKSERMVRHYWRTALLQLRRKTKDIFPRE